MKYHVCLDNMSNNPGDHVTVEIRIDMIDIELRHNSKRHFDATDLEANTMAKSERSGKSIDTKSTIVQSLKSILLVKARLINLF